VTGGAIEASSLGNGSCAAGNETEHGAIIALTLPMA